MDINIAGMNKDELKNIESRRKKIIFFIMLLFSGLLVYILISAPSLVADYMIQIGHEDDNFMFSSAMYFVYFTNIGVTLIGYGIIIALLNSSGGIVESLRIVLNSGIKNPITLLFAMVWVSVFMLLVGWNSFGVNGFDFESPMDQMVVGLLSFFGFMVVFLLREKLTGGAD